MPEGGRLTIWTHTEAHEYFSKYERPIVSPKIARDGYVAVHIADSGDGLSEEGIPGDVVDGALKRVEFRNREIRGGVPFGLRLMSKSLRGWLHDGDPESSLEFTRWMEKLKNDVSAGGLSVMLPRPRLPRWQKSEKIHCSFPTGAGEPPVRVTGRLCYREQNARGDVRLGLSFLADKPDTGRRNAFNRINEMAARFETL